jgi:peptide-methionine (S)-S-oxide reductase
MKIVSYLFVFFTVISCTNAQTKKLSLEPKKGQAVAVFASGCFWCTEHVFEAVLGVDEAISGYSGGTTKNPSYEQVGSNRTGHAESIAVFYDPKVISYKELVNVFFASQDPTTPNQQGPDRGSSYRSIAFYKDAIEKKIIEDKIKDLTAKKVFANPIVTEVKPVSDFYEAEDYHQDYVKNNPNQPYVKGVSVPRYNKFKTTYKGKLK